MVLLLVLGGMIVFVIQRDDATTSNVSPQPETNSKVPAVDAPAAPVPDLGQPSDSGDATQIPQPPEEALPAAEESASAWPGPNTVGAAPSPDFPTSLPQWTLLRSWTVLPRIFEDSPWVEAPGPDYSTFPAAQNACGTGRTLVRWRAVNPSSEVVATDLNAINTPGTQVSANAGWMDLDLCHLPAFRLIDSADGSTLTDVTISIQQYLPAP
ncbi:hypothetical protein [Rhodococcus chondri]|uniref:Uncharacterized protein n=1 Tax=Rhodococcus chondri TaxID=3065941 RepID=A0ABU7JYB6_9NOCA|nr:hypothetical protein [Rhodococcus sp. CC-R104]MEE2034792.1 hypothetical protein [Rhodococcus sp. CC-R104]